MIERVLSLLSRRPRLRWLRGYLRGSRHDCLPRFRRWRIEGPFDSSYSLAIVNREIALALAESGHSVTLVSRDGPGPFPPNETFLADHPRIAAMWRDGAGAPAAEICLRNTYPPFVDGMAGERRGLVCYAWEESGFPQEYVDAFNAHLDVVTVSSGFVAKVLHDNGVRVPIRVIGCGVEQVLRLEQAALADTKVLQKYRIAEEFCFLHISTCLPRKGVDVLLAAWAGAFDDNDAVVLVIKATANQHHRIEDDVATLASTHPRHARIVLINEHLPATDIHALLRRADVVVAPSRGEGFGLPLAEALALGKPVIATAYGGQSEFCTPDNAWLCEYDFAYSRSHVSTADSVWVEPRIDSLIACLRQAWSAPAAERARRGERGRAVMRENFTWKRVAQRLCAAVVGLEARSGASRRLPKIGLISTWNTRCAVAEHARALAASIPERRLVVFADRAAPPVRPDQANVFRCWDRGGAASLDALYQAIRRTSIDAMVVEFSPGFYDNAAFARLIARLAEDRIATYVFLHCTADAGAGRQQLPDVNALRSAARLFVHSVHDLNNLKNLGLVGNVTLFPFGVPAAITEPRPARSAAAPPVIASFGFQFPDKGFMELIEGFAQLRRKFPDARLLLLACPGQKRDDVGVLENAIRNLELSDCVTLRPDFLPEHDVVEQLASADIIVYPYQRNRRSVSAAVRLGLASLAPVVTTPLKMFDDVAGITHRFAGIEPHHMATGLAELLENPQRLQRYSQAQQAWAEARRWNVLSDRLDAIMYSGECCDDSCPLTTARGNPGDSLKFA